MRSRLLRRCPLALALLMAAAPLQAQQQGIVSGRVVDVETGQPLGGAAVAVLGTGAEAVTGADGTYRLQAPAGTYSILVRLIGYRYERMDGVQVTAGGTTTLDVVLTSHVTVLNPIIVTGGRQEQKSLESPSTIVTVGEEQVEERATVTPVDHVKALPGVDVSQTGLTQANVVARGFNNVFSGALLVMTDYRYARIPSLRVNNFNMIPANQLDIERIEVLLGPASALYGPGSANGVFHIITTSPIDEPGSIVSVAAGERNIFQGQFRSAFRTSDDTGLKVSGEYFRGVDWRHTDPVEEAAADPENPLIGARDFDTGRWAGEARFDWRPGDDTEVVFSGGLNTLLSSVELTGQGAGQVEDWRYTYLQSRFRSGRLFGQAFVNMSDAGDTYLLRTGRSIVDESRTYAAQLQHGVAIGEVQDFVYGVDATFTRPRTEGTITGRNEDDDGINEIGGYVQSSTGITDQLDLVAALRVDEHNHLEDLVWSPRAALIFEPRENQNVRLTYNRAFSTPTTNNLFLDLVAGRADVFGGIGYDVRTFGVPRGGLTFDETCTGGIDELCMYTPFAPGTQLPANGLPLWDDLVMAIVPPDLQPFLLDPGSQPGDPAIESLLRRLNPNPAPGDSPFALDQVGPEPIESLIPTIRNTYEVGYRGILGGRLLVTGDIYQETIEDFVGPLRVETPTVFYDPATVQQFVLTRLDALIQGGVVTPEEAGAIIQGFSQIPLGTVSPDQLDTSDIILTYRNFGDVEYWGGDVGLQFLATDRLTLNGSYSYISEECFDFDEDGDCESASDVALNAPQHKGSVGARWDDDRRGLTLEGRARFVDRFPMNSGVFIGEVPGYGVFDANIGYRIPEWSGASITLSAYNVFDNRHREFVGAPQLGRLLLARLMYEF